jgi:hypothetical protein
MYVIQEAQWTSTPVGTGTKNIAPTGILTSSDTPDNTSKGTQLTLKKEPDNPKSTLHFISSSSLLGLYKRVVYVYFEIEKHQFHPSLLYNYQHSGYGYCN